MTDFDLEYVAKVCPELCKSECEAVRDHVLDTNRPSEIYPAVVKAAARSLFPYQAAPADNVRFMDGRDKLQEALRHLGHADVWLSRVVRNDEVAQIQLDIKCAIHDLDAELGRMGSSSVSR